MLNYVNSSLFSSPARVLVNTVNTVGVMGKGVALEFKKRYPDMYERYRQLCERDELEVGQLWLYRGPDRWVLNFPTKTTWRKPSEPSYIQSGLETFVENYGEWGIDSISFPQLGCGNGGLDWGQQVQPIMEHYLRDLPIAIYIHVHVENESFVPEHEEPDLFNNPQVPDSFTDFWRDIRQLSERKPELRLTTFFKEKPFRLAYVSDESLVLLRESEDHVHIPKKDLYDLWNRLQMAGSVRSNQAPGRIGREFGLVFPLLAQLPYIDPLLMADGYDKLTSRPASGIQLRYQPPSGSADETVARKTIPRAAG